MNTKQLWNSHQRQKFLRAEASRNTFTKGFQDVFSTVDTRVVSLEYTQDWEQYRRNLSRVPRHHKIQTFHRSKPV